MSAENSPNEGGNIVNFWVKNFLTRNAALVEDKNTEYPIAGAEVSKHIQRF